MQATKTAFVVLAAGKGSRFRSQKAKVLHSLGGKPLLLHLLDTLALMNVASSDIFIVVHHKKAQVQAAVGERAQFIEQKEMDGTGGALCVCLQALHGYDKVVVLYGDVPCVSEEQITSMLDESAAAQLVILTAIMPNPSGYGRILRQKSDNQIINIIEDKDASAEQKKIKEVNSGIMVCDTALLERYLPKLNKNNAQGERYLTDVIALAAADGHSLSSVCVEEIFFVQGVNDQTQLASLERAYQKRQVMNLLQQGVRVIDPNRCDIRGEVVIMGSDVVIDVGCIFVGRVVLAEGVHVGAYSVIKNSSLGAHTVIHEMSHIESSEIAENCSIGPYARLRFDANLQANCRVGNFVEIKKSDLAAGVKVNHLSYIGDAKLGEAANIGAGVITCNFDGQRKYVTSVGKGTFIGSNSSLVAPIELGDGVMVAAGSTVTKSVDKGLVIGRAKQRDLPTWSISSMNTKRV